MQAEVASGQSGCGRPGGQRCPEKLTQAFSGHIPIWPIASEEGTDMWQKEQVIDEFQKRGMRITQQRRMLLDVILEGNWTNCKEIFYEARKRDPKLGMATVYRTVSTLEEIGVLTRSYQYSFVSDKDCLRKGCDVR